VYPHKDNSLFRAGLELGCSNFSRGLIDSSGCKNWALLATRVTVCVSKPNEGSVFPVRYIARRSHGRGNPGNFTNAGLDSCFCLNVRSQFAGVDGTKSHCSTFMFHCDRLVVDVRRNDRRGLRQIAQVSRQSIQSEGLIRTVTFGLVMG
jgi:hypothetical protein